MSFEHKKFAVMVAWAFCVLLSAFLIQVPSVGAWAALVGLALIPPAIALRVWPASSMTLSENINRARQ